jgi:tetratricopeptide (TPR) repeat protein
MGELADLWEIFCNWLKGESLLVKFIVGAIGSLLATAIIALVLKLPQRLVRWIRRRRRIAIGEDFPFDRVRPGDFGRWLHDNRMLTCYENPFVPKETEVIYKSHDPASSRRRMYLGAAETGKTRAAYEWVKKILRDDSNAEILIPEGGGLPNPIKEDCVPKLAGTVVLFYDDMHTFMLPKGQAQRRSEERVLSATDRFEDLIEVLDKSCMLYIVCTARREREEAVQPVEGYRGVWETFDILTLKDAPKEEETRMIEKLAEYHDIQLAGEMVEQMADRNRGRSYENTVEFLQKRKDSSLGEQDLEEYAKGTSRRWESQVFHDLQRQNRLVAQLVGAMYTLRFELGLPPYERFVLRAAAIRTGGLFRKRRLRSALNLLCQRGGFEMEDGMILCHDFQLEISAQVSPPVQDCLKRLHRHRRFLSDSERLALAEWHFYRGVDFYEQGELEAAAGEWEKSISLRKDYHEAYNNWGNALLYLAHLRRDEGLFQDSFEKYKRAVEIKPDYGEAYNNWGNALHHLASLRQDEGLYQESIEKFKRSLDINPGDWGAYFNMACSYARRRLVKEVCEALDSAFSLFPDVVDKVNTVSAFDPIRDDPIFCQWAQKHQKDSAT